MLEKSKMNKKSNPEKIPVHAIMNVGFIKIEETDIEDNGKLGLIRSEKTNLIPSFLQFTANLFNRNSTIKLNQ